MKSKRNQILIVDDAEINRVILRQIFENKYDILEAEDGEKAIELLKKNQETLAVILLDIIMPVMDGFAVLEEMSHRKLMNTIPVVLISAEVSEEYEERAYSYGVVDIVNKPFNTSIVKRRVSNVIGLFNYKDNLEVMVHEQTKMLVEQTKTLREQAEKLRFNNNQIIDVMSSIVEFRNLESGQHIQRIKDFTRALAKAVAEDYLEYNLTDEDVDIISVASAMHDVGKIAIPDNILLKPGKLTEEEFEVMKTHTTMGCNIIKEFEGLQDEKYYKYSYDICRHHHERYNGKGYPDGLAGEDIPIAAQIVSLADVYEALVSVRVYKGAFSIQEAYEMIVGGQCGVFSPKILNAFEKVKPEYEELAQVLKE